uniref:Uncharacterized protein n=1 Tax=Globodera pallida TaxID=36090 RepID=A0A183BPM3_GLOPA
MKNPANEPVLEYRKGSAESVALEQELQKLWAEPVEVPLCIGTEKIFRKEQSIKQPMATPDEREIGDPVDSAVVAEEIECAPPAQQPNCSKGGGGGAVDRVEVNGTQKVMLVTAREHRSPLIGLEKCTSVELWDSTNGNVRQKRNADRKAYESCPIGRADEAAEEDGGHWKMRRKMKHDVLCDEDHHRKMKHDV